MTLEEAKRKVMIELDESGEITVLENIDDYIAKLPDIINTVQKELAMFCKEIETESNITIANGYANKPTDCYIVNALVQDDTECDFRELGRRIYAENGDYTLRYQKLPDDIDDTTPDTYEFEIDKDAQEAMIHGICAQICINDEPELYQTYFERYNLAIANIQDKMAKTTKLRFSGGVSL